MPHQIVAVSPVTIGNRYMSTNSRVVDILSVSPTGELIGLMYPSGAVGNRAMAEQYNWNAGGGFASGNDGVPHPNDLVQCLGKTPA